MAGSYTDIKTNLSQVGLDWDWPTGLSLAKLALQFLPNFSGYKDAKLGHILFNR